MSNGVFNSWDREELVDEILEKTSAKQYFLLTSICAVYISITWHKIATNYFVLYGDAFCKTPNITNACDPNCKDFEFKDSEKSFASHYGLVCEFDYLKLLVTQLTFLAHSLGAIIYGIGADTFGRRPLLFLFHGSFIMFSIFFTLVESFWTFCLQRFLTSFSVGGCNVFCYLILLEEFSTKHRELVIGGLNATYVISAVCASISVYYLDWKTAILYMALFSVLSLPVVFFSTESPSWVLEKGRLKETVSILQFLTNAPYPSNDIRDTLLRKPSQKRTKCSVFELFKTPYSCYKIVTIIFGNLLIFSFEGSYNDILRITGDIYMHPIIAGGFHLVIILIWILFSRYFGRIVTIITANTLSFIGFCILIHITHGEFKMVMVYLTGSLLFVSWMTTVLCATETIPVMLRGTILGVMFMLFYLMMAFATASVTFFSALTIKVLSLVAIVLVTVLYSFFPETRPCSIFDKLSNSNETKTLFNLVLKKLGK